METGDRIELAELAELRAVLTEDFDAPFINRVIMCLRTAQPDGGHVSLAEIRTVLQEDISISQTVDRIIMTLRLHLLHLAG